MTEAGDMSGNGEIKIEKGIPFPTVALLRRFATGNIAILPNRTTNQLRRAVSRLRKDNKTVHFDIRTVTENGVKGVRVWRTA